MSHDDFFAESDEQLVPFEDAYREGLGRLAVQAPPAPPLPDALSEPPTRDRRWIAFLATAAVLALVVGVGVRSFSERPVSPAATASESGASPTITPSASPTPSGSASPTASATPSGNASTTPSDSESAKPSPSASATPSTGGVPAPSTNPTSSQSASASSLTPAELALAKSIAGGGLSGPQAKAKAKAWVTKTTYRDFWRIVDTSPLNPDPDQVDSDEPILLVLVMGSVSPTEAPAPSPYPTGIETAFVTVEASIALDPEQAYGTPVFPNMGGMEVLKKFPGPIVELDLTK